MNEEQIIMFEELKSNMNATKVDVLIELIRSIYLTSYKSGADSMIWLDELRKI